jgi:hypothetical protein
MPDSATTDAFIKFLRDNDGIGDKRRLAEKALKTFALTKDRTIHYSADFAVRFSSSKKNSPVFSNTVLSLSKLQKFDNLPLIVCLVTPATLYCFLANSTFLKKISHSSTELSETNIKGSFNGSDIMRDFDGIPNNADNIGRLWAIHEAVGFEENLPRLVAATQGIVPAKQIFAVDAAGKKKILSSPERVEKFLSSKDYCVLKDELDSKVEKYRSEILCASFIENGNIRGNLIEYLIAGEDENLREKIIGALRNKTPDLPKFKNTHDLGDYQRAFEKFDTETDVKTKIMFLNSNPKAYNIDKMLEFLARDKSVFMFFFIGINLDKTIKTVLVSMFDGELLGGTRIIHHWAGRASRGVTQFEGHAINSIIESQSQPAPVPLAQARSFLEKLMALPN